MWYYFTDKARAFINRLKLFSVTITSKDYDFIAVQESLQQFGEKQMLSSRLFFMGADI